MLIVVDDREKEPLNFSIAGYETVVRRLAEGDYTTAAILDYERATGEKIIRIERKSTTGELAANIGRYWERFQKELSKLSLYKYRYIVCEFPLSRVYEFPRNSGIPFYIRRKLRISAKFLLRRIHEIEEKYKVPFIFCESKDEAIQKIIELLSAAEREIRLA